ncbi:MAG: ATP-grasp domain-containing protein [Anaerolineae bacterium]|nr:ATP-grasp domain-containing protein [Anaerolineae bacterium]
MLIIFCADPLDSNQADFMYSAEVEAVKSLGLDYDLISFEDLIAGNANRAVRHIKNQADTVGIYRGWMLKPAQYEQLYRALLSRGVQLINDSTAYQHCHYLPDSYDIIGPHTPKSVWMKTDGNILMPDIMSRLAVFGEQPLIVKDYVKSQKHYWNEACFIPNAADSVGVERVVRRFLELQGGDLNEGLVFRAFVDFEPLSTHAKSGMPLTKEFRVFYVDGQALSYVEYWEQGDYQNLTPPLDKFAEIAKNIHSRFFTMDIAKRKDGEWMIVELGDGQVAGLPEKTDAVAFYRELAHRLNQ